MPETPRLLEGLIDRLEFLTVRSRVSDLEKRTGTWTSRPTAHRPTDTLGKGISGTPLVFWKLAISQVPCRFSSTWS